LVEYEKARTAAAKALELDKTLGEGYAMLGELKFVYEWNFPAAEKYLLRAIELEPNSALAHSQYASYLAARGRFDEAIAESNIAQEIDPNSSETQWDYGRILYLARRYDEAIVQLKRLIEVNKDYQSAYGWIWTAYEMKGDDSSAYESFMKLQKQINPARVELYQKAFETSGWIGVRQKHFEFEKLNEQKPSANFFNLARQCTLLGDREQAFKYLITAIEKRQGQISILNVEPAFDSLRDDPRFDEMLRRAGFK
jgi:tetratricopeptide (TPR) repeat protein